MTSLHLDAKSVAEIKWWFRLVNQLSRQSPPRTPPAAPVEPPQERQKAARIAPGGCPVAMLLRGLVDPRLVALAPGAADRAPRLLGKRRDEPADGVSFMPTSA